MLLGLGISYVLIMRGLDTVYLLILIFLVTIQSRVLQLLLGRHSVVARQGKAGQGSWLIEISYRVELLTRRHPKLGQRPKRPAKALSAARKMRFI